MKVVGGKGGDGCVSFIRFVRESHCFSVMTYLQMFVFGKSSPV